jgi:hypothetical protein
MLENIVLQTGNSYVVREKWEAQNISPSPCKAINFTKFPSFKIYSLHMKLYSLGEVIIWYFIYQHLNT